MYPFYVHRMNLLRFKMWKDKIVEEVRKNREKIFANFDYDMKKYSKYIIEAQKKENRRFITIEEMRKLKKV